MAKKFDPAAYAASKNDSYPPLARTSQIDDAKEED